MEEYKDAPGTEKDVEQYGNDSNHHQSASNLDYQEAIKRISAILDPEIIVISVRSSQISKKSSKDSEENINPEFEVKWDGPNDPRNAQNWSKFRKYCILALVSLQAWMVYVHLGVS